MILCNIVLFLASCAILYYVIRYRIHIYVTYQSSRRPNAQRKAGGSRGLAVNSGEEAASTPDFPDQQLVSALVRLGCQKKHALETVRSLAAEWDGSNFDALLRRAIQKAA